MGYMNDTAIVSRLPRKSKRESPFLVKQMRKFGFTERELGYALNLSTSSVGRRMQGIIPWRRDEMYQILEIFHETPDRMYLYFPPSRKE